MNLETTIAGDTLDFNVEVDEYPASDGWTLKYRLTPRFTSPVQTPIELTATSADGVTYDVTAAPAVTELWAPGSYTWARWVEKSGARQTLDESGQLEVKADPATTAQGHDARSHARKVLDAIQAVIEGRASKDQEEYTILGRSLKRTPLKELREFERDYADRVRAEEAEAALDAGRAPGRRLLARL